MKIIVFSFFESFAHNFQIYMSTHGLNPTLRFVSRNELDLFLLTRVLIKNPTV
jgi:hypothetical protein